MSSPSSVLFTHSIVPLPSPPSTITFDPHPAKLIWQIEHFSSLSGYLESPEFCFPANKKIHFKLKFFPNRLVDYRVGNCSMFDLCMVSTDTNEITNPLYVRSTVSIVDRFGHKHETQVIRNRIVDLHTQSGGSYMINREQLVALDSPFLPNGNLIIHWEIDDSCLKKSFPIPPNPILQDFESLIENGKLSDFALQVDDREFLLHKNILCARSDVFAAMFEHDCEEKLQNRMEIIDISAEAFELMLYFIYTGKMPEMGEHAAELFAAADKYQLKGLKICSEIYLSEHLTTESAANILMLADMHQASNLKTRCINFISEHGDEVKNSAGWKELANKANLLEELLVKMIELKKQTDEFYKKPFKSSRKNRAPTCPSSPSHVPTQTNQFMQEIQSLLEKGQFTDAEVIVGSKTFAVHKNILSVRSKVLADLFEQQNQIEVDITISVDAFEQLLRYLYTGETPTDIKDYALELMEASHKYKLNHLKALCEQSVSDQIDTQSVASVYVRADSVEANFVKHNCFNFISDNVKRVIQTDGWKTFTQTHPDMAVQLLEQIAEIKW